MYKIYLMTYMNNPIYVGITKLKLNIRKNIGYKNIPFYKECIMTILEETDDRTRENFWINHYKDAGYILFNKRKGYTGMSIKEYQNEYREKNKEEIKYNSKSYYIENKEKIKERNKEYREGNKDKIKEYKREYRAKNKEKINEKNKEYRLKNKNR